MLEAFGNYAQRQRLHLRDGFITIQAVADDAWQRRYLGQPPTVFFAFEFNREGHARNVPSRPGMHQLSLPLVAVSYAARGTKRGIGLRARCSPYSSPVSITAW